MRWLRPFLASILFALPASAQWVDGTPTEFGDAKYDQTFTWSFSSAIESPNPNQDVRSCFQRGQITTTGAGSTVNLYDCATATNTANQCRLLVSASTPGTYSANFARGYARVWVQPYGGVPGAAVIQCNQVQNETFDGSSWVPTFPSPGGGSSVEVNGVSVDDPDFRDSTDITFVRCTAPMTPHLDCIDDQDIVAHVIDGSHDHIVDNLSDTSATAGNLDELTDLSVTALHSHAGGVITYPGSCQHTFTTESASDVIMCGRAEGPTTLKALNCTATGSTSPVSEFFHVVECDSAGDNCASSGGVVLMNNLESDAQDLTFSDDLIDDNDWWGIQLLSFATRADFVTCNVEFTQATPPGACRHTFTTEVNTDATLCGKSDGTLSMDSLSCTATGSVTPVAESNVILRCGSGGGSCSGTGGDATVSDLVTNHQDDAFTLARIVDDNDWWGHSMTTPQTRADYLHCNIEYTQISPAEYCYHVFTTEDVGDVIMCGKAKGEITMAALNCSASGGVTPVGQVIDIVECDDDGANCSDSIDGNITAVAIGADYADYIFADNKIDDNDWWGMKLTSYTTRADFLRCQVEYDTL